MRLSYQFFYNIVEKTQTTQLYKFSTEKLNRAKQVIKENSNNTGFLIKWITYTSIFSIILSGGIFFAENKEAKWKDDFLSRIIVALKFTSKNDDVRILSKIWEVFPFIYDLDLPRQAYQEHLVLSGKINEFSSKKEFDDEVFSIKSYQDYVNKASTSIKALDVNYETAYQSLLTAHFFGERLRTLFMYGLFELQVINIVMVARLSYISSSTETNKLKEKTEELSKNN
jgi:hypothetical protein